MSAPGARAERLPLLAAIALAFGVRLLTFREVFQGEDVRFLGTDPWYHMRLVDNLLAHFPWRIGFDPYLFFPGGQPVRAAPLFDLLIAGPAWLLGLGSPPARLVDAIGATMPALLGAAVVVPVYALGLRLWGALAALIAALLVAFVPGHLLTYTLFGFTDHHAAEALLSMASVALLARAADGAKRGAMLAGLALGAYLLAWSGALVLVVVVALWGLVEVALGPRRAGEATDPAQLGAAACALAGAVVLALAAGPASLRVAALATLATAAGLAALPLLLARTRLPAPALPAAALLVGGLALALGVAAFPSLGQRLLADLARLAPQATSRTIGEMQPLLFPGGSFSLGAVVAEFGTAGIVAPVGLALLVRDAWQRGAGAMLLLLWACTALALCLLQVRFAIYAAPVVALLAARACVAALARIRRSDLGLVLVALLLIVPSALQAFAAPPLVAGPDAAWRTALGWLREHTPEPLGDPDRYYDRYEAPADGAFYPYPPGAYGVFSWWDYGYWITRMGRRIPTANPTQRGALAAGEVLIQTSVSDAQAMLADLGARYVIVDDSLAAIGSGAARDDGKFLAIVEWGEEPAGRFVEKLYRRAPSGALDPVVVFHPDYYRTLVVRLARFGGDRVFAHRPSVARVLERATQEGQRFRELVALDSFARFEEAQRALREPGPGEALLVGLDPARSPVPLPPLPQFRRVYPAPGEATAVKIFEVEGADEPPARPPSPAWKHYPLARATEPGGSP